MFLIINLFIFIIITGSALACVESKSWWELWIFLELNSLAFIIFISQENNNENIFVFLLFQTFASTLIIVFIFLTNWSTNQSIEMTPHLLIAISILINIGIFPFHSWIIKVINNISWTLLIILFSWQNLIPLLIVANTIESSKIIFNISIATIILLNFIIINLSNTNIIITISSLIHNTWIFAPILTINEVSILYLLSYSLVLIPLTINFLNTNINEVYSQVLSKNMSKEIKLLIISISGIPPFIGFLANIFVLLTLLESTNNPIIISVLTISSCVTFLVYLQIFTKYFFYETNNTNNNNCFNNNNETNEISLVLITIPILIWY